MIRNDRAEGRTDFNPVNAGAKALLRPQHVEGREDMPLAEVASRIVLTAALDRDKITRVLDRHSEDEVDDHGNVRCACADTAWFDDVFLHHEHQADALIAHLTGQEATR